MVAGGQTDWRSAFIRAGDWCYALNVPCIAGAKTTATFVDFIIIMQAVQLFGMLPYLTMLFVLCKVETII